MYKPGMWWLLNALVWWCGTSSVAAPPDSHWKCPEISQQPLVECSCDLPHTLRCLGGKSALQIIGKSLRLLKTFDSVSLLDCTVHNVTSLSGSLLKGVALHGLVVSSGEIRDVHYMAFQGLGAPLQALGLPNNKLTSVPISALKSLPELDRLDLSGNRMKYVDSFNGLANLSFIDLSNNMITKLSVSTFDDLPQLRILRLRGNRLTFAAISILERHVLSTVEELDLSDNAFVGPLGPTSFPPLLSLINLQLEHNALTSIKMGALFGLENLKSLSLHHNQIDVLEDNSFENLATLVTLNLAHNRIVAVSEASLAHLDNLTELDLSYNFLRALTVDLILPLRKLEVLKLDDNDVSIVAGDALANNTLLKRVTLADNPLNCDCRLIKFAKWLSVSRLDDEDRFSAVCTTPPALENALLANVSATDLICGEDESELSEAIVAQNIKARLNVHNYNYDGFQVVIDWQVDNAAVPYTCDAIFVYEEEGINEVLLGSHHLQCNSSQLENPNVLRVVVPNSTHLQEGHRYRYCIVLLESRQTEIDAGDDLALVLGCSDVLLLDKHVRVLSPSNSSGRLPKAIKIDAKLSNRGDLVVSINMLSTSQCEINVALLEQGSILARKRLNCSQGTFTHRGLVRGPYKVCANIILPSRGIVETETKPHQCVTVFHTEKRRVFSDLDLGLIFVFLVLSVLLFVSLLGVRKVLFKSEITTQRYFLPAELDDKQQHSRYVKLQATTTL